MKKYLFFLLTIISVSLLLPISVMAKRVNLDITAAGVRQVPVAVPWFIDKDQPSVVSGAGREMAALLSRALEFHGFVKIIPSAYYNNGQDTDWRDIGADFAVLGQYISSGSKLIFELRLINVMEGKMILGKRYQASATRKRVMLLKFADEVILKLTGKQGVSNTRIVFVSDESGKKEVYVTDVLGGQDRQITKHRFIAVSPRFVPKGNKITYTSYHNGNPNLYLTDLDLGKTTRAISRRAGLNMAPAWSPDGKTMVITLSKDGNPDLYLMRSNGEIIRRLTRNSGINVSPSFSPDGKKIAFVSDRNGRPQIYVMELKSGKVRRITYQGNENTTPSWSPQGDWIAYTGSFEGNCQIFLIRPDGGQPEQLTSTWGDHESPSWSPDGRQIIFSRKRNNKSEICRIFHNGKGEKSLYRLKGNQTQPQWSTWLRNF
ncbi:MAG: Tol-Pal system beta propeller repeat protein TolB [Thermodesulfobacteriota bacterium]|nr:Tol-Pal system beta propeller repeat protein TolB [Thermodesulfobacteriota bacterium]